MSVDFQQGDYKDLVARKIKEETCRKLRYRQGVFESTDPKYKKLVGKPCHIADYYDPAGEAVVAQKIRFPNKDFIITGDIKQAGLYGQHLWRDSGKMVVITEGEIDALTVSQLQNNKWPVVSLKTGAASAEKAIRDHYEWLCGFEKVVLFFDNDAPGQEAAQAASSLLPPGKAYIAKMSEYKDANEALQAGKGSQVIDAIWGAKLYKTDGVVCASELVKSLSAEVKYGVSLPWPSLNEMTYGVRTKEVWSLLAGSGVGKTEIFKEIAYHFAEELDQKVGLVFLEESPEHTAKCLLGKQMGTPIHIPDHGVSPELIDSEAEKFYGTGKVMIYDHKGTSDWDTVRDKILYMVQACGCKFIFIDHMTAMAEGKNEDINSHIHAIMEDMNSLVNAHDFTIFLISHVRKTAQGQKPPEEGGRVKLDDAYGSGAIKQRSNFILAFERNTQEQDEDKRNQSLLRVLKDRYTGRANGFILPLVYDAKAYRLREGDEVSPFGDEDEEF